MEDLYFSYFYRFVYNRFNIIAKLIYGSILLSTLFLGSYFEGNQDFSMLIMILLGIDIQISNFSLSLLSLFSSQISLLKVQEDLCLKRKSLGKIQRSDHFFYFPECENQESSLRYKSLSLFSGVYGISGASGCGKSSYLKMWRSLNKNNVLYFDFSSCGFFKKLYDEKFSFEENLYDYICFYAIKGVYVFIFDEFFNHFKEEEVLMIISYFEKISYEKGLLFLMVDHRLKFEKEILCESLKA